MKRIFITLLSLLYSAEAIAALSGAVQTNAGELAIVTSDIEATWTVYPGSYSTSFAVDKEGKTLYFASPKQGEVTIIAASVVDGKAVIDTHILYNGIPAPEPAPNVELKPEPTPEPETIESVIKAEAEGKDPAELTALADTFAAVVDGIDRGVVTTPTGARETFRAIWIDKGTTANINALNDLSGLITAISGRVDNSTLETLKTGYSEAAAALRLIITDKAQTPAKTQAGGCSGGNCPANTGRGWRR